MRRAFGQWRPRGLASVSNFGLAVENNCIAISLAVAGLVAALSTSSILVIANSLRCQDVPLLRAPGRRQCGRSDGAGMIILALLIPLTLLMGVIGLGAFFWSLDNGQYDDLEGDAERILLDDGDAPLPARPMPTPKEVPRHAVQPYRCVWLPVLKRSGPGQLRGLVHTYDVIDARPAAEVPSASGGPQHLHDQTRWPATSRFR